MRTAVKTLTEMGIRCYSLPRLVRDLASVPMCNAFLGKGVVCARSLSTRKLVIVKGRKGKMDLRMRGLVGGGLCVPGCPRRQRASRSLGITVTATIIYSRFEEHLLPWGSCFRQCVRWFLGKGCCGTALDVCCGHADLLPIMGSFPNGSGSTVYRTCANYSDSISDVTQYEGSAGFSPRRVSGSCVKRVVVAPPVRYITLDSSFGKGCTHALPLSSGSAACLRWRPSTRAWEW